MKGRVGSQIIHGRGDGHRVHRARKPSRPPVATFTANLQAISPELVDSLVDIVAEALVLEFQRDAAPAVGSLRGTGR